MASVETQNKVYDELDDEPRTPNEIAATVGKDQKTVQSALLLLLATKPDVRFKQIGRLRIFWRGRKK